MSVDPNLVLQLLITVANLGLQMRRRGIELDGQTQKQLQDLLQTLHNEMNEWE